jgi:hypothetical protein
MRISEDPLFAGAAFGPFATSKAFTLSAGFGTKTVYVQFKDTSGTFSNVFNDQINYSASCASRDVTPPTCVVTAVRRGNPQQQDVTVTDTGSGLDSITNVVVSNGTVAIPPFTSGTTNGVVVTATKTDQTKKTRWSFDATDKAGNTKHCV